MAFSNMCDLTKGTLFIIPVFTTFSLIMNCNFYFGSGQGTKQQRCCHGDLVQSTLCQYVQVILGLIWSLPRCLRSTSAVAVLFGKHVRILLLVYCSPYHADPAQCCICRFCFPPCSHRIPAEPVPLERS